MCNCLQNLFYGDVCLRLLVLLANVKTNNLFKGCMFCQLETKIIYDCSFIFSAKLCVYWVDVETGVKFLGL